MLNYQPTTINGVMLGISTPVTDSRGSFARVFELQALRDAGFTNEVAWVDLNQSRSRRGTIRGMHFRLDDQQFKQIRVCNGAIFDVVIDLRPSSPTYLTTYETELSAENYRHLIIPPGCAHGFQALSTNVDLLLNSSVQYDSSVDAGFAWNDERFDIPWPIANALMSDRDRTAPPYSKIQAKANSIFRHLAIEVKP